MQVIQHFGDSDIFFHDPPNKSPSFNSMQLVVQWIKVDQSWSFKGREYVVLSVNFRRLIFLSYNILSRFWSPTASWYIFQLFHHFKMMLMHLLCRIDQCLKHPNKLLCLAGSQDVPRISEWNRASSSSSPPGSRRKDICENLGVSREFQGLDGCQKDQHLAAPMWSTPWKTGHLISLQGVRFGLCTT